MKHYVNIEEYDSIDDLLDDAETMYGPGSFVIIGRHRKRNVAAYGLDANEDGEAVVFPGENVPTLVESKRAKLPRRPSGRLA